MGTHIRNLLHQMVLYGHLMVETSRANRNTKKYIELFLANLPGNASVYNRNFKIGVSNLWMEMCVWASEKIVEQRFKEWPAFVTESTYGKLIMSTGVFFCLLHAVEDNLGKKVSFALQGIFAQIPKPGTLFLCIHGWDHIDNPLDVEQLILFTQGFNKRNEEQRFYIRKNCIKIAVFYRHVRRSKETNILGFPLGTWIFQSPAIN